MSALTSLERVQLAKCYKNKANNAESRGLDFDISILTFANIKAQKVCAYSGLPFGTGDDALSVERIDNNVGYIDGNVIPVRHVLNTLRADFDIHQVEAKIIECVDKAVNIESAIAISILRRDAAVSALQAIPSETQVISQTVIKPRIPAAIYTKWRHRFNECVGATNKLAQREALITESIDTLRKPGISAKRAKSHKDLIALHESKIADERKRAQSKSDRYRDYVKGFKTVSRQIEVANKLPTEHIKLRSTIESTQADIDRLQRDLCRVDEYSKNLKQILAGLKKFDKLSDADLLKVKLGLPLDTSMLKVLKHKLGYSCLVNQL